jgi:hypothetical protein
MTAHNTPDDGVSTVCSPLTHLHWCADHHGRVRIFSRAGEPDLSSDRSQFLSQERACISIRISDALLRRVGANGGGILGHMLITNNISVNNAGYGITENYGSAGPGNRYINNVVFNNRSGDMALDPIGHSVQVGTIIADPLFVNYTGAGDGDYRLQFNSPARDHGTSSGAPTYDIDGLTRPVWDIGAYQSGTVRCLWPWRVRQSHRAPGRKHHGRKKIEGE